MCISTGEEALACHATHDLVKESRTPADLTQEDDLGDLEDLRRPSLGICDPTEVGQMSLHRDLSAALSVRPLSELTEEEHLAVAIQLSLHDAQVTHGSCNTLIFVISS